MLSLILPTYNEAENLPGLLEKLREAMEGMPYEVIVVDDDSPDRTWDVARSIGGPVHVLRRIGRRGLASAIKEGFALAKGDVLAVMDADLQHDPALLPKLVEVIRSGATIAIASRYRRGSEVMDFRRSRLLGSHIATILARCMAPSTVTDPLSGCFAIRKSAWDLVEMRLRPRGFKILLEILAFLPEGSSVTEVPLHFGVRSSGVSKLTSTIALAFLMQLLSLAFRSPRGSFLFFSASCLVIASLLAPRVLELRYLYLDRELRGEVQQALQDLTHEEGWLLSDIILTKVEDSRITFHHRRHLRGRDPDECYVLDWRQSKRELCPSS